MLNHSTHFLYDVFVVLWKCYMTTELNDIHRYGIESGVADPVWDYYMIRISLSRWQDHRDKPGFSTDYRVRILCVKFIRRLLSQI